MQTEAVTGDEKAGTAVEQQKKRRSAEAMQQVFEIREDTPLRTEA